MRAAATSMVLAGLALAAAGCAPSIGNDPVPAAMEWDATPPPRVTSPSLLLVNPATDRIDFSLAGIPVPDQCDEQTQLIVYYICVRG